MQPKAEALAALAATCNLHSTHNYGDLRSFPVLCHGDFCCKTWRYGTGNVCLVQIECSQSSSCQTCGGTHEMQHAYCAHILAEEISNRCLLYENTIEPQHQRIQKVKILLDHSHEHVGTTHKQRTFARLNGLKGSFYNVKNRICLETTETLRANPLCSNSM